MFEYQVDGWCKFGERDYYETGCDPNAYVSFADTTVWRAKTVDGLIKQLREFVGVDDDYEIELDACGEEGRVDISVMETNDSYTAREWDIELWKKGELALWATTYTFMVERVEREPVRLVEVEDGV